MRVGIALLLAGCVVPGPLKTDYDELGRIVANISPEMAMECAPREYALAQSNQDFAGLELAQGDTRRAREHLDQGLLNARVAFFFAWAVFGFVFFWGFGRLRPVNCILEFSAVLV